MLKSTVLLSLALAAVAPMASAQMQKCEINGEEVNPANGHTTRDKTGIMRCRFENGKLQREEEVKAGKFIGLRRFHHDDGGYDEAQINERGNRHGPAREYYANKKLKSESSYDNGSNVGLSTRYYPDGKPQRIAFYEAGKELAVVEFNQNGQHTRLRCATRSVFAQDRDLCGFTSGGAEVALYSQRGPLMSKVQYKAGVLQTQTDFSDSGAKARTVTIGSDSRITRNFFPDGKIRDELTVREAPSGRNGRDGSEKEWAQNGQQIRETVWSNGYKTSETLWYMNGSMKERALAAGAERDAAVATERFWDNGKPQSTQTRKGQRVVGKASHFDESGRLRKEELYDERGVLKSRRELDEAGKVVKDDEFHEDGSRKAR